MHREYGKIIINDHFCVQSIHFCRSYTVKLNFRIVWGENTDSRKAVENKVDVGDTVTVTISKITGYTGVVTETMKLDVKFLLNGKVVIVSYFLICLKRNRRCITLISAIKTTQN